MSPEQIGVPAFVILTLGGAFMGLLLKGTLRLGRECEAMEERLKEMQADRDWWRSRAERGARMTETATNVLDRVVPPNAS